MTKNLCYSLMLAGALALTGCGKKMNQFKSDYFSVNPNPLEVVGDKVPAKVTGNIPGKFFVKNAEVTVTPYLEYNGMEVASTPYTFQGEKVRGNNTVVSYDKGGTVTIPIQYNYTPEMRKSELVLAFTVKQGGKQYVLPTVLSLLRHWPMSVQLIRQSLPTNSSASSTKNMTPTSASSSIRLISAPVS